MLVEQITSRQNPLVKRAVRVRLGDEPSHMFVEGARLVEELVASEVAVEAILYTQAYADSERGGALLDRVRSARFRGALVPEAVLDAVCDVETPQGVVAIAARPVYELDEALAGDAPLAVVLDGLQDPGNVGAVVRAAEAAGAAGAVTTPGTAEPYGAKALRSAMGSAFRLPIARRVTVAEVARAAGLRGIRVVATVAEGGAAHTDVDWRLPAVVLVGNEGGGLSDEAVRLASERVTIPLAAPVESLNAAVAAGVILFEAARQRASGTTKRRRGRS